MNSPTTYRNKLNSGNKTNKPFQNESWNEVYRERFMKFESEKNKKIREQQRLKKEKAEQEEKEILDNLKSNTKVVSSKEAEEYGRKMYNEATKRNIKKKISSNKKQADTTNTTKKKNMNNSIGDYADDITIDESGNINYRFIVSLLF